MKQWAGREQRQTHIFQMKKLMKWLGQHRRPSEEQGDLPASSSKGSKSNVQEL